MKKPLTSFAVGFAIYFFLLAIFAFAFFKKFNAPQVSLEIDAALIGEIAQHEKSKSKLEKTPELQKISNQKNAKEKSAEEKLEPDEAKADKEKESDSKKNTAQKIPPIFQPLPQIPEELRAEAFRTKAVARFYIDAAGNVTLVELVVPSNNPKLNQLLLKSLRKWKFESSRTGITQDITVTFKVE
jgi:protein TonB